MSPDARGLLHAVDPPVPAGWACVSCSRCARTVESDVLGVALLLRLLGWARLDDEVLCVGCRQDRGDPADLTARITSRL
jgi:hypothetical protein